MKYILDNYDNLDLNEEIEKIKGCDEVDLTLVPTNKICLFLLGIIFAYGKKIKLLNIDELNLEATSKSFSLMPYVWSKICDDKFPNSDYSDIVTQMDERIENIKRLGIKNTAITNNPIENKIFLICPVRNATPFQRKFIEDFVEDKKENGFIVHAPHLHTVQKDMFGGYTICLQNALAISSSSEIDLYYDQNSMGSVFDLGVAYALNKKLVLLNEEVLFNENDAIDNIINNWQQNKKIHVLVKKHNV